jgi:hypothetical protein
VLRETGLGFLYLMITVTYRFLLSGLGFPMPPNLFDSLAFLNLFRPSPMILETYVENHYQVKKYTSHLSRLEESLGNDLKVFEVPPISLVWLAMESATNKGEKMQFVIIQNDYDEYGELTDYFHVETYYTEGEAVKHLEALENNQPNECFEILTFRRKS